MLGFRAFLWALFLICWWRQSTGRWHTQQFLIRTAISWKSWLTTLKAERYREVVVSASSFLQLPLVHFEVVEWGRLECPLIVNSLSFPLEIYFFHITIAPKYLKVPVRFFLSPVCSQSLCSLDWPLVLFVPQVDITMDQTSSVSLLRMPSSPYRIAPWAHSPLVFNVYHFLIRWVSRL